MSYLTAAGPLAWPLVLLAACSLFFALRSLRAGGHRDVPVALGALGGTGVLALLSVVLGYQRAVSPLGAGHEEAATLYLLGLSESLNGLVIALATGLVVTLVLTVRAVRAGGSKTQAVTGTREPERQPAG